MLNSTFNLLKLIIELLWEKSMNLKESFLISSSNTTPTLLSFLKNKNTQRNVSLGASKHCLAILIKNQKSSLSVFNGMNPTKSIFSSFSSPFQMYLKSMISLKLNKAVLTLNTCLKELFFTGELTTTLFFEWNKAINFNGSGLTTLHWQRRHGKRLF